MIPPTGTRAPTTTVWGNHLLVLLPDMWPEELGGYACGPGIFGVLDSDARSFDMCTTHRAPQPAQSSGFNSFISLLGQAPCGKRLCKESGRHKL